VQLCDGSPVKDLYLANCKNDDLSLSDLLYKLNINPTGICYGQAR
jgi:hypothetical protein